MTTKLHMKPEFDESKNEWMLEVKITFEMKTYKKGTKLTKG
jgi:hypothetical protein